MASPIPAASRITFPSIVRSARIFSVIFALMVGASIVALISTLIALFSGNLSALLLNALIFALSAGAAAALWLTRNQNAVVTAARAVTITKPLSSLNA